MLRVSQLIITPVLLDEHDAPVRPDPLVFQGDAEGTAVEKAQDWLTKIDEKIAEATA